MGRLALPSSFATLFAVTLFGVACGSPPTIESIQASLQTGSKGEIVDFTGLCLGPKGQSSAVETVVELATCNGAPSQQWTYENGSFVNSNGNCLDVQWGHTTNGTPVWMYSCNGSAAQHWSQTNGQLVGAGAQCLDVSGFNSVVGLAMQIWSCTGGKNQQFKFASGSTYEGCFADSATRDLPDLASQDGSNTTQACVATCLAVGYAYAGVQWGQQCFCGNSFGGQGPSTNCNMPCSGAASETCGGNWANSVYATGVASSPPPTHGACGSANGVAVSSAPTAKLCASGTASAVSGSGPWTWSCAGTNGGSSAACSAPLAAAGPWTTLRSPALYVATTGSDSSGNGSINAPYQTLGKAQAVARAGTTKVIYLRAGVYPLNSAVQLTGADDGETWSTYPGDPVDSAILDSHGMPFTGGGSYTGVLTNSQFSVNGASNVTIDGLELRYSPGGGIWVGGGGSGNAILNCAIHDNNAGGPPFNVGDGQNALGVFPGWYSGITSDGSSNFTIANNHVYNMMTSCITVSGGSDHSNLTIKNNFVDACNLTSFDSGGIYIQDATNGSVISTNVRVFNNFIRDAGGRDVNGVYSGHTYVGGKKTNPGSNDTHAMYSDGPSYNISWTGNIVTGNVSTAGMFHDCKNIVYTGNIFDMGSPSTWVIWNQSDIVNGGNVWSGNIILSNYTGSSVVPAYQSESDANTTTQPMTISDNVYFNYAGGAVDSSGDNHPTAGDSHPVLEDPQISGWTYEIAPGSPVFGAPVNFPPIAGGWGPPGFVVPQVGTAPSCPH